MKKLAVFLTLVFATFTVFADTVWLKSGDMLYGHVSLVDNDTLLLKTNYAQTIAIDRKKIKTFSVDNPLKIQKGLFGKKCKVQKILPSTHDGAILLVLENGDVEPFSLDDKFTIILSHKKELFNEYFFNGNIKGGANYDRGKNKTDQFFLIGQIVVRRDLWRHTLDGNMRRKTENGRAKTYNYTAGYALDRFITPSFFWTNATSYQRDWIEDIKSKYTVGTGPGYEFWNDELGAFSIASLLNYQHLEYRKNDSNNIALGSIKWDYYRYLMSKKFRLFSNGSIGRSFDRSVDLEFSSSMGISYSFTRWLSVNMTYSRERNKTREGDTSSSNYGVGLGVNW